MDACGPSLLLEPVLSSAVIATALLGAYAGEASAAELLRAMARGERIATVAHFEPDARFDTRWVALTRGPTARAIGSTATSRVVLHAGLADALLVSARTAGEARRHAAACRCSWCPAGRRGSQLDEYATVDGQRAADVYLRCDVQLPARNRLGPAGRRADGDRSRLRHRPRRAVRRGRRHHAGAARRDRRVPADAAAVRPTHRAIPGAAASGCRYGDPSGASPLDELSRGAALHVCR